MYTMEDVKKLRERTGAGVSDCSKALKECDGDLEKAIDYLREKGIATAAKKSGRIASEGICYAEVRGNVAVMLEVNCESDFVSKGELFLSFAKEIADYIFNNDVKNVEEVIEAMTARQTEYIQKIGENLKIRRFVKYVSDNKLEKYIHMGGKIGVIVECEGAITDDTIFDVALQIAAAKPSYVKADEVPADVIEKEKEILLAQIKNDPKLANKPEQIIIKMVDGRINKYYDENCLLNQEFIKDSSLTVSALLAKENATVVKFTRFEMGEGLEKKNEDFAAEVAATMKK